MASDSQKLIVHFAAAMLSNPALLRAPLFRGDDEKNRSMMYQIHAAAEQLALLVHLSGTQSEILKHGGNVQNDRSAATRSRSQSTTGKNRSKSRSRTERHDRRHRPGQFTDPRVRPGRGTSPSSSSLRQISASRTTVRTESRAPHLRGKVLGKGAFSAAARQLLRSGDLLEAAGSWPRMTGFLIHCDPLWHGMKHVLIVAVDETDMIRQLYDHGFCRVGQVAEKHRVTAAFRSTEDWTRFEQCSLCELCTECTPGRWAA